MTSNNAPARILRVRVKVKLAHSHTCSGVRVTDKDWDGYGIYSYAAKLEVGKLDLRVTVC